MKFKNTWKKFWTLERRANHGFTLVELVVVIAILGILGGVGTVGYSGYIKSAHKKADQVLVGNIVRAIETGTNSTMFVPPESLSLSATTYPVGFVVLNTEGGTTLTPTTTSKVVSGECEFEYDVKVEYVESKNLVITCDKGKDTTVKPVYTLKSTVISYCTKHSDTSQLQTLTAPVTNRYATGYNTWKSNGQVFGVCLGHKDLTASGYLAVASTATAENPVKFTENIDALYTLTSSGLCQKAENPGLNAGTAPNENSGVLHDAIAAAFGSDANLALQYDGWGENEDGYTHSTFYSYAPDVFQNVQAQTKTLIDATKNDTIVWTANQMGINLNSYLTKGEYEHSGDLLDSFSTFVSENMTEQEWKTAWAREGTVGHDQGGFGLDGKGAKNDYLWAARMAYNSSFASYCDAVGLSDRYATNSGTSYTDLVVNYGESEVGGMLKIPSVANTWAFNQTGEGSLKQDFANAGDASGEIFEAYKNLYNNQYVGKPVCEKNAAVFYSTVKSLASTGNVALEGGTSDAYFAYYNSYLTEMSNLYNTAQQKADGGVMIIVTVKDGVMTCDVSPSAADPRPAD